MEESELAEISRKLDVLVKIYAYQLVAGKNMPEGVPILRRLGLNSDEIAAVYDTSKGTVKVRLAESKKKASATKASMIKKQSNPKA